MQRTLLASVILLSLSACGSDSDEVLNLDEPLNLNVSETADGSTTITVDDAAEAGEVTTVSDEVTTVSNEQATDDASEDVLIISDDAGSSTSDGGQANVDADSDADGEQTISDDAGSSSSDGGETISDDAGSSSSDGGETISDDAGSSSSDGGETISDDAGSSSSDGGQIADDAASGTSDGGQTDDEPASDNDAASDNDSASDDAVAVVATTTDAGSFASDNFGGTLLRRSTLTAGPQMEVCTSMSNQDNFSQITNLGDFILHNNAWRTFRAAPGYEWEQCITTNTNGAAVGWNYDWGPGVTGISGNPLPSGDFFVRSYPELIYGVKDEFRTSAPQSVTGLPVVLTDLPNIQIDYSYDGPQFGDSRIVDASNNPRFPNGSTISGERNVAVESFMYEPDAAGNCSTGIVTRNGGSNHTFEVMVWLDAGAERLPAAPNDFVADLNIRGEDYKVYTKGGDPRYIAFVAQNPQSTGTIYWNDYVDWARANSHQVSELFGARSNTVEIQDDWCVANILVGTEIFWGAGNMDIFEWTITQTQ